VKCIYLNRDVYLQYFHKVGIMETVSPKVSCKILCSGRWTV
jgi:hypothetical protein